MTKYIVSTLTSSVSYTIYGEINPGNIETLPGTRVPLKQIPPIKKFITIRGGANIPSETSGVGEMVKDKYGIPLWTAYGVITAVTDEDFELLRNNHVFQKHESKGYIKVINSDIRGNNKAIMKEVKQMEPKDPFAQLDNDRFKSNMKMKIVNADVNDNFEDIPKN